MTKSLNEIVNDICQYISRGTARAKALEAVKSRTCEWPSTSDDFQRLISAICECIRSCPNSQAGIISSGLCALDTVVDDFGKALTASLSVHERETRPAFPATIKAVQLAAWALTDGKNVLLESEGAFEYCCKVIRTLVTILLPANNLLQSFTPGIAGALIFGLLEFPANRPRHRDLVKSTVSTVFKSFPFDLDRVVVGKLIESIDRYISKSGRVSEVCFGIQLMGDLCHRAPLEAREVVAVSNPSLGFQITNRVISILTPSLGHANVDQLVSACEDTLRVLLTLLASSPVVDPGNDLVGLEELSSQLHQIEPPIVDLLIDVDMARLGSYDVLLEESPDSVSSRVIERCLRMDPFYIEKKFEVFWAKKYYKSLCSILNKLDVESAEMKALVTHWFKQLDESELSSSIQALPVVTALARFGIRIEKISSIIDSFEVCVDSASVIASCLTAYRLKDKQALLVCLSAFLSLEEWLNMILALNGHSQSVSRETKPVDVLRDCLAFRDVLAPHRTVSIPSSCLGKSFKMVERLLGSSPDEGFARRLGAYVLLGSVDVVTVKCDSCVLTTALSLASRQGPSSSQFDLKKALIESAKILGVTVRLCNCEVHRDVVGEPRSLLSQVPLTIGTYLTQSEENITPSNTNCGSVSFSDLVTAKAKSVLLKSKLQSIGGVDRELVNHLLTLEPEGMDIDGICKHFIEKSNSIDRVDFLRRIGVERIARLSLPSLSGYPLLVSCFHLGSDPSDSDFDIVQCAVKIASIPSSPDRDKTRLVADIITDGSYAMYAIDRIEKNLSSLEFRRILSAGLLVAMEASAPAELVEVIASEHGLEHIVRSDTRARNFLLSAILPRENVLDTVDECFELEAAFVLAGRSVVKQPMDLVSACKLSSRYWYMQYLKGRTTENPDNPPSKKHKANPPIDLLEDFQIESRSVPSVDSLARSLLFAVSFVSCRSDPDPRLIKLSYSLMKDYSDVVKFQGPQPDPFDERLGWTSNESPTYPLSETCRLVCDLAALLDLDSLLLTVCARNEIFSANVLPCLFLLVSGAGQKLVDESITLVNSRISTHTVSHIVKGIAVAKWWEFRGRKISAPCCLSILFERFVKRLNLGVLCDLHMKDPIESYFIANLFASSDLQVNCRLSHLFSHSESLPLILKCLDRLGVKINSFSLNFHPAVRGLVAQLRNDAISLLHEPDDQQGLDMLGISKLNEWTDLGSENKINAFTHDSKSREILLVFSKESRRTFLTRIESFLSSPISNENIAILIRILKTSFPPAQADEHNTALTHLIGFLRKHGRVHQARFLADHTIQSCLTSLNPGIRLEIFYHFAKCLWQLGHGQEAVTVLTALCVSDEAGRVDDPRVALCIPRILSRTAQWAGELRLETVDEIRQNYIEKAISLSLRNHDLKSVVKSKIRFVKVIDPVVANDGSLKNLVCEEFGFLTDIVSSGVVVDSKSAWFASRLVSLWFNHPAVTSPLIGRCRSALATSRSLLPFFYQIASRLGDTGPEFKKELLLLVLETTRNHPSICLPPILQLRQVSGGLGSKSVVVAKLEQERSKQAEYVIEKLKSIPETKVVIESMIAAFKFYFNLAMLKVVAMEPVIGSSTRPNCGNRPRRLVSEVDGYRDYAAAIRAGNATVLTCDGCVVDSIQPEFSIADSGKSLPKILTLVDAQGRLHKQIVKGNDDLRNDAVLQQLFSLVDSATSASMRSYKVVPITACAGIAEWVANTTTIGSYLVGYPDESTGAHARYFPSDLAASTVKAKMVHARQQNAKKELESALLNTYKSCCSKFSPSMKYVFHEHFASPKDWYFAQSKFSSSVAATSIVGFIVGLGDRHPNNILIDTKTGEVVHIDYGICFDAGRLLKIPEIVPFRLTRDMVDGLGSLGTQGPFSKTCEDLLLALKKNSALVTAVVEVFVVDPLFNWAVASLGSDNAQVALDGVKKKLQGFLEATDVIPLTPAAQVDRLIRAATDPRNLSLMFAGWQPWL